MQLAIDVITGGGVLHAHGPPDPDGKVEVFFSNPDLLWANEHPYPRFGQGAFAAALQELHRQVTGRPIPHCRYFGKPNAEPYSLARSLLSAQALALGQPAGRLAIYAVGDNPRADVRGANAAGPPWVSVLVRTGVFRAPPGVNCGIDPAHVVVQDVEAAVDMVLHRQREARWHALC